MKQPIEFTNGVVLLNDYLWLSGALDSMPAFSAHSRLIIYDEQDNKPWLWFDVDWWCAAIAKFKIEGISAVCAMSQEGEVVLCFLGGGEPGEDSTPTEYEKIPGAGLNAEDAKGWGYMEELRQIGDHLYACGVSGQVYKREGENRWVHMDNGILQPIGKDDFWIPHDINGPHESAIYLAGCVFTKGTPPFLSFWNGSIWRNISLPEVAESIAQIFVESETRIWLCGQNGTLLLGNARDGFKSLSRIEDNQLFTSITMFGGKVYLGSDQGPFVYDPARPDLGIYELKTNLFPKLEDVNFVDAHDGVLWTFGSKDIARFDGRSWRRIKYPDNVSIR
jgi:hypothetical protein